MLTKRIILLTVLLLLVSVTVLSASTYTKEFNKTVDFKSGGRIAVKNVNGRIDVTSWDKKSVKIEAEIKVKASSRRDADEILERVNILIEQRADELIIEPDFPKKNSGGGFWDWVFGSRNNQVSVNFKITVPKTSDLGLKSTNGKVTALNIKGEVELGTVNGGIEAEEIDGPLEAHTTNGSIKIDDLKGSLDAHTTNGSISARVTKFENNDNIRMNTTNASLKLKLPANVKAYVRASTVNGSIRTDFPLTVKGKIAKKSLRGEINGGGGKIDLSTVNGSITIYEN